MAIYEFACEECGLKFEVMKGMSLSDEPEKCPECGNVAKKLVSVANHAFAHTPTGPVPQNTGIHQIDYNADRVIGRDAERKWQKIEERTKYKRGKLQEAARTQGVDAKMDHLVRTREGAGDYRLITEPERLEVNTRRELANAVTKAVANEKASAKEQR